MCDNMDAPWPLALSEISQTQKDKYHKISLRCGIQKSNR